MVPPSCPASCPPVLSAGCGMKSDGENIMPESFSVASGGMGDPMGNPPRPELNHVADGQPNQTITDEIS